MEKAIKKFSDWFYTHKTRNSIVAFIAIGLTLYFGFTGVSKKDLERTEDNIISTLRTPPGELQEEMAKVNIKANEFYTSGLKKIDKSNFEGAVIDLNKSISLVNTPSAHLAVGNAYSLLGKYEEASMHFAVALYEGTAQKNKDVTKKARENLAFIEANKNLAANKWQPIQIAKLEQPPLISHSVGYSVGSDKTGTSEVLILYDVDVIINSTDKRDFILKTDGDYYEVKVVVLEP